MTLRFLIVTILLFTTIGSELEQDERVQRTGGLFGSRRPALSELGEK